MIEFRKLSKFILEEYLSLGHDGYQTTAIYKITTQENKNKISFTLEYTELEEAFNKTYQISNDTFYDYNKIISEGFSSGAYDKNKIVGIIIARKYEWNKSFWIEFIEVAETYRGRGIGTRLLRKLLRNIKDSNFRIIELETQNTNVPAINFYRKNGFEITGLNLTLYNKPDHLDEKAIYMTKQLQFNRTSG